MNELSVSTGISHIDSSFQRTMESLAQLKESINQLYYHLGKAQGIIETIEIFYQHPVQGKKVGSEINNTSVLEPPMEGKGVVLTKTERMLTSADVARDVKEFVIPVGTTHIRDWAFWGCTGLTNVTISNSVKSIGDAAFWGCTGLTSVTIPGSVTSIRKLAFYCCNGLTSVAIPGSVTTIGDWAFCGCTGLTSVTISDGVTTIGEEAFYGCTGLTSVAIPNSVTSIWWEAFRGCPKLTIRTPEGSYAESWAKDYKIKVETF